MIHPHGTFPNIQDDGMDVQPATSSAFAIEKFSTTREEAPYGDCTKFWSQTPYIDYLNNETAFDQKVAKPEFHQLTLIFVPALHEVFHVISFQKKMPLLSS